MAPRKKEIKPILATKHDFVDSLDNMIQQSIMLLQCIDTILQHSPDLKARDILTERVNAFRDAIFTKG